MQHRRTCTMATKNASRWFRGSKGSNVYGDVSSNKGPSGCFYAPLDTSRPVPEKVMVMEEAVSVHEPMDRTKAEAEAARLPPPLPTIDTIYNALLLFTDYHPEYIRFSVCFAQNSMLEVIYILRLDLAQT